MLITIVWAVVALGAGVLVGWALNAARVARAGAERDAALAERQRVESAISEARRRTEEATAARAAAEARAAQVERSREEINSLFVSEAQRAFRNVSESLVQMNKTQVDGSLDAKKAEIAGLLQPLRDMLDTYRAELLSSEQARNTSYGGLQEQIRTLLLAQEATQREASRLANALQSPTVQGSWGEMSLRRCVELAGMSEYCRDFETQPTFFTDEGRRVRPDVIVNLPNQRVIAIDAKAPLSEYTAACNEADEAQRRLLLEQHARLVRRHVDSLSRRDYQSSVGETLDFTVMFIPGEHFLAAALATDPTLLDYAAEKRVFLATPTVLLPLLRAVAASWKAEKTEENAKRMHEAGVELFNRFVIAMEKIAAVGRALEGTVSRYNEAIRSIDARLWPKGEEMQRMAGSGKSLVAPEQLEAVPLQSSKLRLTMQSEDEGEVVPMERP
jgi:DNA recombination protein RmuC